MSSQYPLRKIASLSCRGGGKRAKAARVAAAARGDQILVSSTTADIVNSSEIDFGDPITVELKGIEGTHTLRPLNWAQRSTGD